MTEEEIAAAAEAKRIAEEAAEKERLAKLAAEANLTDEEKFNKRVAEKAAADLKDIKDKLNAAYEKAANAEKRAKELEDAAKEAHKKRLEDEGKHQELLELRLKESEEKRIAAETRNTELSRDVAVRAALGTISFRNERAIEIAYREIIGNLVQDSTGNWAHKSGISIAQFVSDFSKDEENSFLFKPKSNNGSGSSNSGTSTSTSNQKDSLFKMSQAEVLKLAEAGKLPNQRK